MATAKELIEFLSEMRSKAPDEMLNALLKEISKVAFYEGFALQLTMAVAKYYEKFVTTCDHKCDKCDTAELIRFVVIKVTEKENILPQILDLIDQDGWQKFLSLAEETMIKKGTDCESLLDKIANGKFTPSDLGFKWPPPPNTKESVN